MIKEFKEFISKGNVVDLAVAVIIGAAFGAIVKSFSTDILGGFLAAIGGTPNLDDSFVLDVGKGKVRFGALLTQVINFLIVAFAMFVVVKAINRAQRIRTKEDAATEAAEATEVDLLTEIRDLLATR